MKADASANRSGFTLLELMAVIAILAILVSIALPSYQSFMLRVHRTEAVVTLLGVAGCQEQVFATTGRYDTTKCIPQELEHYTVRIDPFEITDSLLFTAWAEPLGAQIRDRCGSLGLDQTGRNRVTSDDADAQECWNGR